jgi:hypothetical protein
VRAHAGARPGRIATRILTLARSHPHSRGRPRMYARRWFTKLGHKGAEPRCFRFAIKCHSVIDCQCSNMPIFIKWSKGRKSGRTGVQWEEKEKITWIEDKGLMTFSLTLFWDEKKQKYAPKTVTISIERHVRNKKSQRMGVVDLDLTEFADVENPVVNKKLKLDIEDGPFELGILRCYLSCKYVPDGEDSDDGATTDDADDKDKKIEDDEEEAAERVEPFIPRHKTPVVAKKNSRAPLPRRDLEITENDDDGTRRRKLLLRLQDEGKLCALCQKKIPQLRCTVCKQELCRKCDAALHSEPAMAVHPRDEFHFEMPQVPVARQETQEEKQAKIRSRGMRMKIDAVVELAKISQQEAVEYLKKAEWDVDDAVELAKSDPNVRTQVTFAPRPVVQAEDQPPAQYNPSANGDGAGKKGGLKQKLTRDKEDLIEDRDEEEVVMLDGSDKYSDSDDDKSPEKGGKGVGDKKDKEEQLRLQRQAQQRKVSRPRPRKHPRSSSTLSCPISLSGLASVSAVCLARLLSLSSVSRSG